MRQRQDLAQMLATLDLLTHVSLAYSECMILQVYFDVEIDGKPEGMLRNGTRCSDGANQSEST
jgi:hypothetical protein